MKKDNTAKKVKCPRCGELAVWENNPFRPFCGERCKMIDLGKWADGSYAIEGEDLNDISSEDV